MKILNLLNKDWVVINKNKRLFYRKDKSIICKYYFSKFMKDDKNIYIMIMKDRKYIYIDCRVLGANLSITLDFNLLNDSDQVLLDLDENIFINKFKKFINTEEGFNIIIHLAKEISLSFPININAEWIKIKIL